MLVCEFSLCVPGQLKRSVCYDEKWNEPELKKIDLNICQLCSKQKQNKNPQLNISMKCEKAIDFEEEENFQRPVQNVIKLFFHRH